MQAVKSIVVRSAVLSSLALAMNAQSVPATTQTNEDAVSARVAHFLTNCVAKPQPDYHFSKVAVWIIDDFIHPAFKPPARVESYGEFSKTIVMQNFTNTIRTTNVATFFDVRAVFRPILSFADANPDTIIVVDINVFGKTADETTQGLVGTLSRCGLVFVAGAGDRGIANCSFPAGYPGVIGVGSVKFGTNRRADYSNYGDCVQLAAMEDELVVPVGDKLMAEVATEGTGFAASRVTGLIANRLTQVLSNASSAKLFNNAYRRLAAAAVPALFPDSRAVGFSEKVKFIGRH